MTAAGGTAERPEARQSQRLDIYLKRCRLIKRRSLAQSACLAGLIQLNGSPARPGKKVRPGDELRLRHAGQILQLEVLSLPGRGDRRVLLGELPYRILGSEPAPREKDLEVLFHFDDGEAGADRDDDWYPRRDGADKGE